MNRREAITSLAGIAALPATTYANGQQGSDSITTLPYVTKVEPFSPVAMSLEERKKEYVICKQRGHAGNTNNMTLAVMRPPGYVEFSTCQYCGTQYRFVTTMEENGAPE